MDVRVVLELPAPGVQDAGAPRESGPKEALVCGEPFEGARRGVEHGLVGDALMRADEGAEGLGDRKGQKKMGPRQLCVQVMLEPLLGCMLLTLGTVAVPTGMVDAVVSPTVWALREAVSICAALALLDGADDLLVRGG
jgi:hypothetical protein